MDDEELPISEGELHRHFEEIHRRTVYIWVTSSISTILVYLVLLWFGGQFIVSTFSPDGPLSANIEWWTGYGIVAIIVALAFTEGLKVVLREIGERVETYELRRLADDLGENAVDQDHQ